MDKRSLIFIILLCGALFFVNLYFTNQQQEQERAWHEQQKAKQELLISQKSEDIAKRTVSIKSLPLVDIFLDDAGSDFVTSGVISKGIILTIGWDVSIPNKVFVRQHGKIGEFTPYYLNRPDPIGDQEVILLNSPIVFSENGDKPLPIVDMPIFGQYDLQLVTFIKDNMDTPVSIGLGEYVDGQFSSLRSVKKEDKTPSPAVALFKNDEGYFTVGVVVGYQERLVDIEDFDAVAPFLDKEEVGEEVTDQVEEKLFVLENGFQQLVFSNVGGSLVEINLPFKKDSDVSVVMPIEVDRLLKQDDPKMATYPIRSYNKINEKGETVSVKSGQLGGFYPLIRRDFYEQQTKRWLTIPAQYNALNVVSEYPEVAELVYDVKEWDQEHIVFQATQQHRKITKTFRILPTDNAAPYVFEVDIAVEGDKRGLWVTTGVPEAEWIVGAAAPALKYRITRGGKSSVESLDLPQDAQTVTSLNPDWVCNSNGFFGVILDPLTDASGGWRTLRAAGGTVPSRLISLQAEHPSWNAQDLPGYMMMLPLHQKAHFRVFAGPFSTSILNQVDEIFTDPVTGIGPDYILSQSSHGWFTFISEPFSKFLFFIMNIFHTLTGSWALSIVLVTVVLKILLYPLNAWSTRSMLGMQEIAPQVAKIQEKHKNNKQKAQMETMELYRANKVNPFGGCLPMLIQMPFLLGMFDLLKSTFALRGATFIPGWIDDLASPDVLFSWNFHIPMIGSEFHLLPVILGGLMFVQSRMSAAAPKDVSQMSDQQRQQKAMTTLMPVFMTVLFYSFPSGLNIYWISSTLLGIVQQWWMQKRRKKVTAKA